MSRRERYALRRLVAVCVLGLVIGAIGTGYRILEDNPGAEAPQQSTAGVVVEVGDGESLWDVAERVRPRRSADEVVTQLRRANDLDSAEVRVGQVLRVPEPAER